MNSIEWAHASVGFDYVSPADVMGMTSDPDANENDTDAGVFFGEGVMLYGDPAQLADVLQRAADAVRAAHDLPAFTLAQEDREALARALDDAYCYRLGEADGPDDPDLDDTDAEAIRSHAAVTERLDLHLDSVFH